MWLTELLDFRGWIWENSAEDVSTAIKLPRVTRSFRTFIQDQASSLACLHPSSCPKAFRFVRNLSLSLSARSRLQICCGSLADTHFSSQPLFSSLKLSSARWPASFLTVVWLSALGYLNGKYSHMGTLSKILAFGEQTGGWALMCEVCHGLRRL